MIDFHTHSNRSDGSDAPAAVMDLAAAAGLTAVALTDHDTVDGLPAASRRAAELGLGFLTGIEISCHTSDRTVHLLGYGFDANDPGLLAALERQQQARVNRNELLIERLVELGHSITLADVVSLTDGGSVGRPHFARVLVDRGYVESIEQAFDELLADGRPAYIERRELPAAEAIEMIASAGGVTAWAHPVRNGLTDDSQLQPALEELVSAGLTGLECWHGRYDSRQRRRMVKVARRHALVPTGGSDYHGAYKTGLNVGTGTGDLQVPDSVFTELEERIQELRK